MTNEQIYKMVTDKVIAKIESGEMLSWSQAWEKAGESHFAYNRVSKKCYSLLNQFMLSHSGEYATFKQWSDLGGKIRKGEKAEYVVQYFFKDVKTGNMVVNEETGEEEEEVKSLCRMTTSAVFHISQVDGVESIEGDGISFETEPIEEAERVAKEYIKKSGVKLYNEKRSDEAFYRPADDSITVPCLEQYENANDYYGTLFHEMVHSTGHSSRLNRLNNMALASRRTEYSKEELVAELGSAFLLNRLGINDESTDESSIAYLQGWIKPLKNDVKMIVSASAKAEKAVAYIMGDC